MKFRRSSKSVIALLTAVLLLVCQTAFNAQAWGTSPATSAGPAAAVPCHGVPEDTVDLESPTPATVAAGCEASKAVGDAVKIPTLAAAYVLPVAIVYDTAGPRRFLAARSTLQFVCSSPPLTLLHCRFLN